MHACTVSGCLEVERGAERRGLRLGDLPDVLPVPDRSCASLPRTRGRWGGGEASCKYVSLYVNVACMR